MADLVVFKGNDGKLEGFGDKGRRAWAKFRRTVGEMEVGETMRISFHLPRSGLHHRFFFSKLAGLFDRQERFSDIEHLRIWLTVGAGYADLMLAGTGGNMVAVPKSLAFHKMDEAEFVDLHQRITGFMWTPHARAFLWPHLGDDATYEQVEAWHGEFQR